MSDNWVEQFDKNDWAPCNDCYKVIEETRCYEDLCKVCQHNSDEHWKLELELCEVYAFIEQIQELRNFEGYFFKEIEKVRKGK